MPRPVLAVDPGFAAGGGAAVLLAPDQRLLAAFAWRRRGTVAPSLVLLWRTPVRPRGRLDGILTGYRLGVAVDNVLRSDVVTSWRLVVEDAFVGKNPRAAINSVRWAGAFAGPLEDGAHGCPVLYATARVWRHEAFGISPGTKGPDAKLLTAERLPLSLRVAIDDVASAVGGAEHITDAVGLGLWALGVRVEPVAKPRKRRKQ